jgi:hypothetical protein
MGYMLVCTVSTLAAFLLVSLATLKIDSMYSVCVVLSSLVQFADMRVAVELLNGVLYCSACKDYVYDMEFEQIYQLEHLRLLESLARLSGECLVSSVMVYT